MTTKRNFSIIEKAVKESGNVVGIWDTDMEKISLKELNKVIDAIKFGDTTDIAVTIRRKNYIVEMAVVDAEFDFKLYSQDEFIDTYGWDYFDDEE